MPRTSSLRRREWHSPLPEAIKPSTTTAAFGTLIAKVASASAVGMAKSAIVTLFGDVRKEIRTVRAGAR
jgi:hypothetical protein